MPAFFFQNAAEIVVRLRVVRGQFDGALQKLQRLVQRLLLPADDAEMKFGGGGTGLQAQGLGELRRRVFASRVLRQHGSQFVVQVGTGWLKLDGAMEFGDRAIQIARLAGARGPRDDRAAPAVRRGARWDCARGSWRGP